VDTPVVRKSNKTVFTIICSDTTQFHGSPLTSIKVGTILTIVGELTGRKLEAQEISTRSKSGGGTSFGSSGPSTGPKRVGSV
jgi:hypothetical protein